jgi:hypothetical protein
LADPLLTLELVLPRLTRSILAFALVVSFGLARVHAQQGVEDRVPPVNDTPASSEGEAPPSARMFGVLPNYTTVEEGRAAQPLTITQTFKMAARGSFDPYVFPFVGVVAGVNQSSNKPYAQRYAIALADNSIGNFLTTAIMPSVTHQDPRYFQSGTGNIARRALYAASRSVITRGASSGAQFNLSEIGGNAIAAGVSNLYYTSSAERTVTAMLSRWVMQVTWDTLSNELKEFWPDIRSSMAARRHSKSDN